MSKTYRTEDFANDVAARIPALRRYARSLTREGTEAEDLLQDCMERALTRQSQFQPGTNLNAWLFRIMYSLFINSKRREKRQRQNLEAERLARRDITPPAQDHAMELHQVQQACDELSPAHRQAIQLLAIEQRSHEEVSQMTGVPVATTKTRLFRARERLRNDLALWRDGGRSAGAAINPGSPADKAGLVGVDRQAQQLGDVIVAVEGEQVRTVPELSRALEEVGIGNTARLTVLRNNERRTVEVKVGDVS